MESEVASGFGPLEPLVFGLPGEQGEAVVAAVGHKALASLYPFACELATVAHLQELGGLERRAWPPSGEGVELGLVIADLDLLLRRPETVLEAPSGWPWMVVVDERHDDGHAFAGRDLLAGRAAFVMVAWDPAGPPAVRCGRCFQVNSTATADLFMDWLLNPAAFALTREFARGRLVKAFFTRAGQEPPPRKLAAEDYRRRLAGDQYYSVGALARESTVALERFLLVQPVRAEVEVEECGPIAERIEVPGREPARTECRLLPGPAVFWPPAFRKDEFKPELIERYLFVWGGEVGSAAGAG